MQGKVKTARKTVQRFLSCDPLAGDFVEWSSYTYTYNNPIQFVDPTGMSSEQHDYIYDEQEDGSWKRREGGEDDGGEDFHTYVHRNGKTSYYTSYDRKLVTVDPQKVREMLKNFGKPSALSQAWNSPVARKLMPDLPKLGLSFSGIAGTGGGVSIEANWVIRGPEASFVPIFTTTVSAGAGYSPDFTIDIGGSSYLGDVNEIRASMLSTDYKKGEGASIWTGGGVAAGGKIGATFSYTPRSMMNSWEINVGLGLPAGPVPFNAAMGISNTYILQNRP